MINQEFHLENSPRLHERCLVRKPKCLKLLNFEVDCSHRRPVPQTFSKQQNIFKKHNKMKNSHSLNFLSRSLDQQNWKTLLQPSSHEIIKMLIISEEISFFMSFLRCCISDLRIISCVLQINNWKELWWKFCHKYKGVLHCYVCLFKIILEMALKF